MGWATFLVVLSFFAGTVTLHNVTRSKPSHNCTDLSYIPEISGITCTCTAGNPGGNLTWMLGNTSLAAGVNDNQLSLPPGVLKRDNDRKVLVCQDDGVEPLSVMLPLNIAYGPDTVELQVYQRYNTSSLVIVNCHAAGLNPRTPDMVQWGGPCRGHTGFTCILDPQKTKVKGVNITCRVTNSANNGHTVQAAMLVQKDGSEDPTDPLKWTVIAASLLGLFAFIIVVVTLLFLGFRNHFKAKKRASGSKSRKQNTNLGFGCSSAKLKDPRPKYFPGRSLW
ncbi:uncharacterized protein LOC143287307 [Babylonia areolata]|uniref:uncharacterized protein LOC143287307 n=1 Tax=Babylonia areolata TaxID=304850 RepID=UPI003FCF1CD3